VTRNETWQYCTIQKRIWTPYRVGERMNREQARRNYVVFRADQDERMSVVAALLHDKFGINPELNHAGVLLFRVAENVSLQITDLKGKWLASVFIFSAGVWYKEFDSPEDAFNDATVEIKRWFTDTLNVVNNFAVRVERKE